LQESLIARLLSNVTLIFLPANTTSVTQPLDAGIIANFKHHYRTLVVRRGCNWIDENPSSTFTEYLKGLNMSNAIFWIAKSWELVTIATITNCFRHCGISNSAGAPEPEPLPTQIDTEFSALLEAIQLTEESFDDSEALPYDTNPAVDIEQAIVEVEEVAEDVEEEEEPVVTTKECRRYLNFMFQYVTSYPDEQEMYNVLENFSTLFFKHAGGLQRQATIEEFGFSNSSMH
jgi:hypothetical protein